ncbi:hypothetical protein DTO027B5_8124 [Paecilomyces variotii]|nr:hypothetical protein DTO169C6_8257 [Paecilomyces variotii]KAJ9329124.1 hypothetical protein DTO027B3_524 [Paecilomyces variotii]KAJ9330145.1 hypothetical protein DTO027B5_8124 [Paecilomyces variotii]
MGHEGAGRGPTGSRSAINPPSRQIFNYSAFSTLTLLHSVLCLSILCFCFPPPSHSLYLLLLSTDRYLSPLLFHRSRHFPRRTHL